MHVAESREEAEYLGTGGGDIPGRLYPAVGAGAPPRSGAARSPVAYLEALGALPPACLVVHAVHVDDADCRALRRQGAAVAHCPRSNAALAGGAAPVPALLAHGIPVGLGTDSLASADSLDLWDEMRAARDAHGLPAGAVLRMATLGGAEALGVHAEVGTLEAGKRADLIAVSVGALGSREPEAVLLADTRGADLLLSLVDGECRVCRPEVTTPCP
jgi:cytosine/adenosine deaminase-related metal-dependent hydrolase